MSSRRSSMPCVPLEKRERERDYKRRIMFDDARYLSLSLLLSPSALLYYVMALLYIYKYMWYSLFSFMCIPTDVLRCLRSTNLHTSRRSSHTHTHTYSSVGYSYTYINISARSINTIHDTVELPVVNWEETTTGTVHLTWHHSSSPSPPCLPIRLHLRLRLHPTCHFLMYSARKTRRRRCVSGPATSERSSARSRCRLCQYSGRRQR